MSYIIYDKILNMKVGIIYKITHPKWNSSCCYIGRTTETIEKRFKGHIQEAKKTKLSIKDGDGKLHKMMEASGLKLTVIEEIDSADTLEELLNLERKYIKEYDAVKKGLNKVKGSRYITPREETISVIIKNQKIKASSKNQLCKKLDIKFSTVNSWLSNGATLQEAVDQSVKAHNMTLAKRGSIKAFRRVYDSYNDLAKDKRANKHGWTGRELSKKHKNGDKKDLEKILITPIKKLSKKIKIDLPGGLIKNYDSIKSALEDWENLVKDFSLQISYKKPAYQTVVSYLNEGQEPEQALGLIDRPWKKELKDIYKLKNDKGYKLIGKLKGLGKPVVDNDKKEIFSTAKRFAKEYNYEYTTIAEELKKGLTPEQIRKKRNDF
jgi:phage pi2 protein 07